MAEKTTRLQIQKQRDLKTLFTDFVNYLTGDDGLLLKTVGLWSGTVLILSLVIGYFVLDIRPGIEQVFRLRHKFEGGDFVLLAFCSLLFPVSQAILTLVVNQLMLLRDADNTAPRAALASAFNNGFSSQVKKYLPNFIVVYIPYYFISYALNQLGGFTLFEDGGTLDFEPFNEQLNTWTPGILLAALFPPVFYFAFSALFVGLRDGIGASEALVKIRKISADHMKQIWLLSFVIVLIAGVLRELIYHYTRELYAIYYGPGWFYTTQFFVNFSEFFLTLFVQIAMVLIFGNVEARYLSQGQPENPEPVDPITEKQDG